MTLRIGVLGAARITRTALLLPAAVTDGVVVAAVAARSPERAAKWAASRGIPRVHASYDELLADDSLDAVYIPLPAALHGAWTLKAIAAGKHVLVEKPFTANAGQARAVETAADASSLVVMEAHHPSFHPLTSRIREIVKSGMLGDLTRAAAWFHGPIPPSGDIRWNLALGGGSMMDLGCYPVRLIRDVLGEPTVSSAVALRRGDIDRRMTVRLDLAGLPVTVDCGMWSSRVIGAGLVVEGSLGRLHVTAPYQPQLFARITVDGAGLRLREWADRKPSYTFQLEAFRDAVEHGGSNLCPPAEAVRTMQVIDDSYRAAGMQPRRPA